MTECRPKLAVMKFASCDGCQLTLLDMEDELLTIARAVQISHFAEASSSLAPGPYDLTLVEGSITTREDRQRLTQLREDSKYLVTIGACATSGGVQALRNFGSHDEFMRGVYARPDYIETLATSTPIAAHVKVDFELRGCPVDKHQLLEVIASLLAGHRPKTSTESVCQACKRRGNVCVVVAQDMPCLGPVTQAGCGAICPAYDRGCYGCFGPTRQPNPKSLSDHLLRQRLGEVECAMLLHGINAYAPEFATEGQRLWELAGVPKPLHASLHSDEEGAQE
ncbi:MAG: oxidoreductase [Planctomycetaceae bacterium]|nr:oxidoreductase [Planctomycetaceae bacterium]